MISKIFSKIQQQYDNFINSPQIQGLKLYDKQTLVKIGVIAFILIIAYYCILFVVFSNKNSDNSQSKKPSRYSYIVPGSAQSQGIENSFNMFFNYVNNKDYQKAYELMSASFIKENDVTLESFTQYIQNIYKQRITYAISYINSEKNKSNFYYVILLIKNTDDSTSEKKVTYCIAYENNSYKIQIPDMVFVP